MHVHCPQADHAIVDDLSAHRGSNAIALSHAPRTLTHTGSPQYTPAPRVDKGATVLKNEEIVRAIHRGVFNAHGQFERLSGDASWMADRGIQGLEGLVVSHIFRAISNHKSMKAGETPILELPYSYIKNWTGARGRGRPLESKRRVDIALLNGQEKPIHVIEVKQKWNKKTGIEDVEKLRNLLATFGPRRGGTLKSGFLSVYWQVKNRPSLDQKMDNVEANVKKMLKRKDSIVGHRFYREVYGPVERKDGKGWEYGSHIIELYRRNQRKGCQRNRSNFC